MPHPQKTTTILRESFKCNPMNKPMAWKTTKHTFLHNKKDIFRDFVLERSHYSEK